MALERADYVLFGTVAAGVAIVVADTSILPQTGSWWVLGEIGFGLVLAAIIAEVILSVRRTSRLRKP